MNENEKLEKMLMFIKETINSYSVDDDWLILDVYNAILGDTYGSIDDIPIDILLESI